MKTNWRLQLNRRRIHSRTSFFRFDNIPYQNVCIKFCTNQNSELIFFCSEKNVNSNSLVKNRNKKASCHSSHEQCSNIFFVIVFNNCTKKLISSVCVCEWPYVLVPVHCELLENKSDETKRNKTNKLNKTIQYNQKYLHIQHTYTPVRKLNFLALWFIIVFFVQYLW